MARVKPVVESDADPSGAQRGHGGEAAGHGLGVMAQHPELEREEVGEHRIDVGGPRSVAEAATPRSDNLGQGAEALDVVALVGAHRAARGGGRDVDAAAAEHLPEDGDRRHAAVIHRGAGPIEDDRLDRASVAHE